MAGGPQPEGICCGSLGTRTDLDLWARPPPSLAVLLPGCGAGCKHPGRARRAKARVGTAGEGSWRLGDGAGAAGLQDLRSWPFQPFLDIIAGD